MTGPKWQTITKEVMFTLRQAGSRNIRAALFIHGFTGHHEETWTNKDNGVSFPFLLQQDQEFRDYDVFSFQYRTTAVSGTSIKKIAKQLADEIDQQRKKYEQIVLITHSMGGLVAMRYILDQLAAGHDFPIRGLALYGVPINGSYLVTMAKLAGSVLKFAVPKGGGILSWLIGKNDQIEQLDPASEFIQELNDEWALRVVNGGHSSEEAKRRALLPVRVVTGEKDLVVKEISARGTYGSIDWHSVECGHVDLVKPTGIDDVRYILAKTFLAECRPALNRDALLRLRQLSDDLLEARNLPLLKDWEYEVHLHGGGQYQKDDPLLAAGFSPFVVKRCRCHMILPEKVLRIGVAWGLNATNAAWKRNPSYVHQMLVRDLPDDERTALSQVIEQVLERDDANQSWSSLFPRLELSIVYAGRRFDLTGGAIERGNNLMLREYAIPADLSDAVHEDVLFDLTFHSYAPKGTKSFTLKFPWLHLGFNGLIVVHSVIKQFSVSQFLSGGRELTRTPDYFGKKSELKLETNDVVLAGTRVEIDWQVDKLSEGIDV